jgi:hypothetical protein
MKVVRVGGVEILTQPSVIAGIFEACAVLVSSPGGFQLPCALSVRGTSPVLCT